MTVDSYAVDARFYDFWHPPEAPDIPLWQSFAARTEHPVLEVGVGTGRVALALARAGFDVVGIDPSPAMLAAARAKAEEDALDIELIEGRLPELMFEPGSFGLVLFPSDVFLAFHDAEEQLENLKSARRVLHADGLVVLDVPGPAQWLDPSLNGQPILVCSRSLPSGEQLDVWHLREDDLARQERLLRVAYELTAPDGSVRRFFSEHLLRYVYPAEADALLRAAGLAPVDRYGDYDLGPLTNDSERMIVVAKGVAA